MEKPQTFESLKSISSLYEVHAHSILANSTKRKLLIEYYNTNNELNDTIRGNLVDLLHANGSNNLDVQIGTWSFLNNYSKQISVSLPAGDGGSS
ncbi:Uncharacterized protein FWK35_00015216 [Aphis craccivora]|uniref:Uncharacterized protein n=1 Tax=Aphis craccivora TaxID=307492 RepID=A0A6G0YB24_APHCR|nr:Uncharacterized protein FWK35_00015216 [Aphis craccivora]